MSILKLLQQNVTITAAYTEVAVVIPAGLGGRVNEVTLALRPAATPGNLFWYTVSTANATNNAAGLPATYGTIPVGSTRTIRGALGAQTIYVQSDQPNQKLELDYYADT